MARWVKARMWIPQQPFECERMFVTTGETLERAVLLTEAQAITKEGDAKLGDDLRIEAGQRLTSDEPAHPVLPSCSDRILEQGADLGPGSIRIKIARRSESMSFVDGG